MLTPSQRERIHDALVDLAERAKLEVRDGSSYKATILLRAPHLPDGDVLVTEDEAAAIVVAVQRASRQASAPASEADVAEARRLMRLEA